MDKSTIIQLIEEHGYRQTGAFEETHYYFEGNDRFLCYVTPHNGTEMKHLIRAELVSAFDRWSNAQLEELFETKEELLSALESTKNMVSDEAGVEKEDVALVLSEGLQNFLSECIQEGKYVTVEGSFPRMLTDEELSYINGELESIGQEVLVYECEVCREYSEGTHPFHMLRHIKGESPFAMDEEEAFQKRSITYGDLRDEMRKVDAYFQEYVKSQPTSKAKRVFKRYLDFPAIPTKGLMTERELELKIGYIRDHYPLLADIRNTKEFETLTVIFREFRVTIEMMSKRKEGLGE